MDAMGVNNAVEVDELVHVISYAKLFVSHTNSEDYKDPMGFTFMVGFGVKPLTMIFISVVIIFPCFLNLHSS